MIKKISRGSESLEVVPVLEAVLLVLVRCRASVKLASDSKATGIDKWFFLIRDVAMRLLV